MQKSRWNIFIITGIFLFFLSSCAGKSNLFNEKNKSETHVPRKFGATYMTMNNNYFEVLNDSIRTVVEANGDVLITRDPLQDQEKQNKQIQEMIDEGVQAIFANPVDWQKIAPALKNCKEHQIPVFIVDTNVLDEDYVVSSIVSDNYDAGVQNAKDMMSKRKSANIVIINHKNIYSTQQRVKGFLDTIKNHNQYKVVSESKIVVELEVAMEEMKKIISSGVDFDVVMGGNDPTALGALAALQLNHWDRDVKDVLIYGVDGSPDAKAMIKASYMEGTSAQFPMEIGTTAAETAYRYLAGEAVKSSITVPVTLITKDNIDDFDLAGWQ